MRRLILALTLIAATASAPLVAQTAPSTQTPAPPQGRGSSPTPQAALAPAAPTTPRAPALYMPGVSAVSAATNIKLEIALTDNYSGTAVTKTVSLLTLQSNGGMIRTGTGMAYLNVDAIAVAYQNGVVSVKLTFEYLAPRITEGPRAGASVPGLNESITVVLQDGKPLLVSQSADAASDRKVTVEVTATILK